MKQEIFELKEELSQVRKDKFEIECQLKDALDMVRIFVRKSQSIGF